MDVEYAPTGAPAGGADGAANGEVSGQPAAAPTEGTVEVAASPDAAATEQQAQSAGEEAAAAEAAEQVDPVAEQVERCVDAVRRQSLPDESERGLAQVSTLVRTILAKPDEPKLRRHRADLFNIKKYVLGIPGVLALAEVFGFRLDAEPGPRRMFQLPDDVFDPDVLARGLAALDACRERGGAPLPAPGPRVGCIAPGCTYFGDPRRGNLCSVCYNKKRGLMPGSPSSQPPLRPNQCVTRCGNFGSPKFRGMCSACYAKRRPGLRRFRVRALVVLAAIRLRRGVPVRPKQEHPNRCWLCEAKVSIETVCKCGYVFCTRHREAATHKCTFDYAREHRRKLMQNNPNIDKERMDRM